VCSSDLSFIENKINKKEPIKFNMGCGNDKILGYIGVDKHSDTADLKVDVLKMDLPNDVADEIMASHLIEHLPQHRAPEILHKWHNSLKPKGKLVLETPSFEEMCKDYLNAKDEAEKRMMMVCIFGAAAEDNSDEVKEKGALYPHLWGYTPQTLTDLCKEIGFKDIKILQPRGKHPGKNFRLEAVK
jgi:SAM-dependent methyltransferase